MALPHHHQYRSPFGDTTYTKVFVGGLAWETPTERMREYFDQFGEILEAVIITDRNTGKSKGYGFVTYRDPQSAIRACEDPNPMIDGRRANCNIAALGRPRPPTPRGRGQGGIGQGALSPSSSSSLSQYGGMQAPMQAMPPPQAANPFFYQTYGYTPYTHGYGYPQTMYDPQYQQAQYYTQLFGSQASSSLNNPYHPSYAYPFQPSRPTFYSASTQRVPGASYIYYPTTQTQLEGPSAAPQTASATASAFSNYALQNPPSSLTRVQPTSSLDSQAQQRATSPTTEVEAAVVVSGGSSST